MTTTSFFILGAPKCGTTSMVYYLGQQPSVFFPKIKEPHYFCRDFSAYCRIKSLHDYRSLYAHHGGRLTGDASVWYLYSKEAIKLISEYNSAARYLVMLRNPTEMLPSLHAQLVYSGREDIESFELAWEEIPKRKDGSRVPQNVLAVEHLFYDEVCSYSQQLKKIYQYVEKDRVKILFFEDFIKNTHEVVNDVLGFVGLDCISTLHSDVINKSKIHRYPRLASFLMYPPTPLRQIKLFFKRRLVGTVPLRPLYAWLSVAKPTTPVSESLRAKIREAYAEDVSELEDIAGRKLNNWIR